jgi:hypothetical protein
MALDLFSRYRTQFKDVSGSTVLAVGDNLSATPRVLRSPRNAKYTIYVQRIVVHVTTDNAATQTFQDDASTVLIIAKTKASPGIGPIVFDFGAEGRALGEGKDFELANSGAGLVADITWEAYERPTGTRTQDQL